MDLGQKGKKGTEAGRHHDLRGNRTFFGKKLHALTKVEANTSTECRAYECEREESFYWRAQTSLCNYMHNGREWKQPEDQETLPPAETSPIFLGQNWKQLSPKDAQNSFSSFHPPVLSCINSFVQHLFSNAAHNRHLVTRVTRSPLMCSHVAVIHTQTMPGGKHTKRNVWQWEHRGRDRLFFSLHQPGGTYKLRLGDKVSVCSARKRERNIPTPESIMCKAEVRGACSRQGLVVGSVERAFGSHPKSESRPVADLDNNSEHFTSTRLIFLQIDMFLSTSSKNQFQSIPMLLRLDIVGLPQRKGQRLCS